MNALFEKYKGLSIAVLGDYCLDEYLWIDANLNEPSLETDMVAYQCVKRETPLGCGGYCCCSIYSETAGLWCAVLVVE